MNIKIFYRSNARRITARRCSDGSVRITVPYGFDIESNKSILDSLIERIDQATASEPERKALFFDGCQLVLEGITFYINYTSKNATTISATYQQLNGHTSGYIYVPHTLDFEDINTEKRISDMMIRIAANVGDRLILQRAKDISLRLNVHPKKWKIGRGHRTLGTCHPDRSITLSALLAFLPAELQEFVICHELAHLSEMNHSERFHNLCNSYLKGRETELMRQLKTYRWPIRR